MTHFTYIVNHSDDAHVAMFSFAMKNKLEQSRLKGRGGWDDPSQCTPEYLRKLLFNEMAKDSADLVDIANYCMMLHQRGWTHV